MKLFERFKQAYPYSNGFVDSLLTIFVISIFVGLFVLIFSSSSFGVESFSEKLVISLGFAAITFVGPTLNTIVSMILVPEKKKESWTVGDEIIIYVLHLSLIVVGNMVYSHYISGKAYNWMFLAQNAFSTICVALIPITIFILLQHNSLLKKNLEEARSLNEKANKFRDLAINENHLLIQLNPDSSVMANEIMYAESDKNYVKVMLNEAKEIRIRCTLKDLEDKLSICPEFVRTHKAYIVNMNKIEHVEGNAQGLKLQLPGYPRPIPVSRTYVPKVKELLLDSEK